MVLCTLPTPRFAIRDTYRFWNEIIHLQGLFERCVSEDDYANATPCFGRLARYCFKDVAARPDFDPMKPSFISIFQPKSGGTFLFNRLLQLGYQEFWWLFAHRNCHSICFASDEALQLYLSGGCACHTHARPHPNILAAFDRAGVEKIWVHLRNPAEAVVSSYYHYLGEGHGGGEVGEQRALDALREAPRQGLVQGVSKEQFVSNHVGWHVDWVAEWLQFAETHPGLVVFSFYDELSSPGALISRVFSELEIGAPGEVDATPGPNDRIRQKTHTDWRHDLDLATQNRLELRIRAGLQSFSIFDRLWS